ncbi:MAG: hypothetical protein H6737_12175 [Alphaproteobacteria bacterium]|nr:hypothetical protein [Alphaproteobacteria bacterium]
MLLLLLTACTTTVRFPPDLWVWEFDTAFDTGFRPEVTPGIVSTVDIDCDVAATAWYAEVRTSGWTTAGTLFMALDALVEQHPLVLVDTDPQGAWDLYRGGPLAPGVDAADYDPATNSQFACASRADLTFAIIVNDRGTGLPDCVVHGPDATTLETHLRSVVPDLSATGCVAF